MYVYKCVMCKKDFSGEPALKNAIGCFCFECRRIMKERQAVGTKKRYKNRHCDGGCYCAWCGKKITNENAYHSTAEDKNRLHGVCRECQNHRDWLLKCIRLSDRPSMYIKFVEEREAPKRIEREALLKAQAVTIVETNNSNSKNDEARLLRIEKMLNRLTNEFGVN